MNNYSELIFKEIRPHVFVDYCHPSSTKYLSMETFPIEFFAIIDLFAKDCKYNINKCYLFNGVFYLSGYDRKVQEENILYLRFGNNRLSIGAIQFAHRRVGYMTELYGILKKIRDAYKLEPIRVENCDYESSCWCIKNGFVPISHGSITYIESI